MVTVRCPNCEATYQLDPAKLADSGRKLKCAQCQTVWIARLPDKVAEPVVVPEVPVVKAITPIEEATERVPDADDVDDGADLPPPDDLMVQRTPGVEALVRVGGWRRFVRGDNIWRSGATGFIILGIVAGAGVFWMKTRPAEMVQTDTKPVAAADTVTPSEVVPAPKGVVLHRVHGEVTDLTGKQGGVALTVRGLLANTTSDTVVVPALRLELLGPDGKVADMWPVSGVSGTLLPGSEQAWTVSLSAPDMSAVRGWRVVFVKDASSTTDVAPASAAE